MELKKGDDETPKDMMLDAAAAGAVVPEAVANAAILNKGHTILLPCVHPWGVLPSKPFVDAKAIG